MLLLSLNLLSSSAGIEVRITCYVCSNFLRATCLNKSVIAIGMGIGFWKKCCPSAGWMYVGKGHAAVDI